MLSKSQVVSLYEAHGILMSVAWAVIMPLGAIMIRLVPSKKAWIIHGGIMIFGLMFVTSGLGIGINRLYAQFEGNIMHADPGRGIHFVTGLTIFSLAWTQPVTGFLHHYFHRLAGQKSLLSSLHVFIGRILMLFAIVNGGVGILVSGYATRAERIAYGVVVAIIWVTYIITSLSFEIERHGGKVLAFKKKPASMAESETRSASTEAQEAELKASSSL